MARTTGKDALALLKTDHKKVKDLFDEFEDAEEASEWKRIADTAIKELKIHSTIEEEIFYPALRQRMGEDPDGLLDEADEEHHAAKVLIGELESMTGDEEHYCAKFWVLAENVRHHIKEEEGELFKKAKKTDIDFKALGELLLARKEELESGELPVDEVIESVKRANLPQAKPAKPIEVPVAEKRGRKGVKAALGLGILAIGLAAGGASAADSGYESPERSKTETPNAPPTNVPNIHNDRSGTVNPGQPNQDTQGLQGSEQGPGSVGGPSGSKMEGRGSGDRAQGESGVSGTGATDQGSAKGLSDRQTTRLVRDTILQDTTPTGASPSGAARLGAVEGLKVTTKAGKVTIRGTVHSQEQKDNIGAKASAIVGSENVNNEILVR